MSAASLRTLLLSLVATAWLLAGCDEGPLDSDEVAEEALVDELSTAATSGTKAATAIPSPAAPAVAPQTAAVPPTANTVAAAPVPAAAIGPTRTMVRTITQTLRQHLPSGAVESHSVQELAFSLTRDLRAGPQQPVEVAGATFQTQCLRVRLTQEIAGQPAFAYDSQGQTAPPADAAFPHAFLPGLGFTFRLNTQGRVSEIVGFDLVLDRCLQALPAAERATARAALPTSPDEALAWYYDDAVGLLPPTPRQQGQQWTYLRQSGGAAPVAVNTRCTLRQLTPHAAEIDLVGLISPTPAPGPSPAGPGGMQLVIRGGRLLGQCQIDLGTGLPVKSQIEQTLDMLVRLPDGSEFEQSRTSLSSLVPLEPPAVASPAAPAADPTALR